MKSIEDLEQEIAALEVKIAKYEQDYESATRDERKDFVALILAARTNLNDLYKEQERLEQLGS